MEHIAPQTADEGFTAIDHAACALGVPASWLKREVHDGRLPALRVGKRFLLDIEQVRAALKARAASKGADA
ncbi:excisionase family DNA-binding protein [Pirellulales bacterium]|nr:excisionase family DNA-binding protein [Pirellulales bacterium]